MQGLEPGELAEVLRRRPDAVAAPSPADLTQLAVRLSARAGVADVVSTLPLPALQVVEALARLGQPPFERAALADELGVDPSTEAGLDATLRVLSQRALVWPDGEELWTAPGLLLEAARAAAPEPFEPVPPAPTLVPADRAAIRAAAAESAAALLEGAAEASSPPFLDLVLRAGLLTREGARLRPAPALADWLDAPPGERLARLLAAWWNGPALRRVVVRVLHDLPPDTAVAGADSLAPLVRWTAPRPVRDAGDAEAAVGAVLAEAALFGVCAATGPDTFAISSLGRALADGRPVAEVAAWMLPEPPPSDPLRVRPTGSVVLCDDPGLLDDVVAALGLERLAPTVAGSREPAAETLAALRAAGYRPEHSGPKVTVRPAVAPAQRARPGVDADELARRLAVPQQRDPSPLEQIRRRAPQLRPEQAQLLAEAVEHGGPVWIRYVDAQGRASERVIENAELAGSVIEAWCRLRRDDRAFTLDKIVAVARPRD
ncbi:MAG TPA: hypothetical protein VL738_20680 [Dactylosporangium sp.]|nr:hypothetical protein [Dactylosporangium sp.]